jgi:hypothetical protein
LFESASAYVNCSGSDNIFVYDDGRKQLLNYCNARERASAFSSIYTLTSVKNVFVQYQYSGNGVFSVAFDWFVIDSPLTTTISQSSSTGTPNSKINSEIN